jgi:pyruvate carboxylase
MQVAMEAVRKSGKICEAAICYTVDITDPKRDKYPLSYYVSLARELERMGAHFLAVKDMAGLMKPMAARKLFTALKAEVGIPATLGAHRAARPVTAADIPALTDVAIKDTCHLTNPRKCTREDFAVIFAQAM